MSLLSSDFCGLSSSLLLGVVCFDCFLFSFEIVWLGGWSVLFPVFYLFGFLVGVETIES